MEEDERPVNASGRRDRRRSDAGANGPQQESGKVRVIGGLRFDLAVGASRFGGTPAAPRRIALQLNLPPPA
jgi:hypothetical protein